MGAGSPTRQRARCAAVTALAGRCTDTASLPMAMTAILKAAALATSTMDADAANAAEDTAEPMAAAAAEEDEPSDAAQL